MNAVARGERTVEGFLFRWAAKILLAAAVLLALVYVGDYLVFIARGKPTDQVEINQYMGAPLKGDKTAFYYEGSGPVACSRTLFPQGGMPTCRTLRKHPSVSEDP